MTHPESGKSEFGYRHTGGHMPERTVLRAPSRRAVSNLQKGRIYDMNIRSCHNFEAFTVSETRGVAAERCEAIMTSKTGFDRFQLPFATKLAPSEKEENASFKKFKIFVRRLVIACAFYFIIIHTHCILQLESTIVKYSPLSIAIISNDGRSFQNNHPDIPFLA